MSHPLIKNLSSSDHVTTEIRPLSFAEAFPQLATKIAENKAPLSELADDYNKAADTLGEKSVNRFPDRAAANKRVPAIYMKLVADPEAHKRWAVKELIGKQRAEDAKTFDEPEMAKHVGAPIVTQVAMTIEEGKQKRLANSAAKAIKSADNRPTPPVASKKKAAAPKPPKPQTPPVIPAWDKESEMPRLRRGAKPLTIKPQSKIYPCRAGTKQALLVDMLARPKGATFSELYDACAATDKPWKGVTIRSGLAWDVSAIKGYGISSEMLNGEEFAEQGREYEAARLGMAPCTPRSDGPVLGWIPGEDYDSEIRLAVYRLTYPKGISAPVPHAAVAAKSA